MSRKLHFFNLYKTRQKYKSKKKNVYTSRKKILNLLNINRPKWRRGEVTGYEGKRLNTTK